MLDLSEPRYGKNEGFVVRRTSTASFEIVLKIQETCNINCTYCYMYNLGNELHRQVPKSAPLAVCEAVGKFVANEFARHRPEYCRIIFHGGEPMLMPPHRFEERMQAIARILDERLEAEQRPRVMFSLQTNATLVTDPWIDLLSRWKIAVGVSLDGPEDVHDRQRLDFQGRGTHAAARRGLAKLTQAAKDGRIMPVGVLCVVDPEADGGRVYRYLVHDLGIDRLDFLLPFMNWETYSDRVQSGVDAYIASAFLAWRQDRCQPNVRLFRTALNRLVAPGLLPSQGDTLSLAHAVIVVESDGSIAPEETLRQTTDGRITQRTVGADDLDSVLADQDFGGAIRASVTRSEQCKNCALLEPCSSGYGVGRVGQRYSTADGFSQRPVYCETFTNLFVEAARVLTAHGKRLDRLGFATAPDRGSPWGTTT